MKLKAKLKKHHNDCFYGFGDSVICEEFVQTEFDIIDDNILVEFNSVRPHKKGWQKFVFKNNKSTTLSYIKTKRGINYELTRWQYRLLDNNNITNFWIKITPR